MTNNTNNTTDTDTKATKRYAVRSGPRESVENTRQAIAHREEFETSGALRGTHAIYFEGELRGASLDRFWQDRKRIDYAVISYKTPIAWHVQTCGCNLSADGKSGHWSACDPEDQKGRWVVVGDKFSVTTTHHQSAVLSAMRLLALESGYQEFETITMHGSI